MPIFWRVLIINGCWILSKAFFCICGEYHMFFFSFSLLIWCIALHILKNPCIPGINPTWLCCMSFLMCCWILFGKILLRIFASMIINDIGLSFLFCVLSLLLLSGWLWPCRMSLEVFFLLQVFKRVLKG